MTDDWVREETRRQVDKFIGLSRDSSLTDAQWNEQTGPRAFAESCLRAGYQRGREDVERDVLYIRCLKHRAEGQLNSEASGGAECGACIAEHLGHWSERALKAEAALAACVPKPEAAGEEPKP